MTDVKSVNAPAIGEAGLKRLYAFCKPKRLMSTSTLFDAGYEQAKADFKERLEQEATLPGSPRTLRDHAEQDVRQGQAYPTPRPVKSPHRIWPW